VNAPGAPTRRGREFAVRGMLMRWTSMVSLICRRRDLTTKTKYSKEEEPNPVRAFAQLRRLGLRLMTVGDANPSRSRVPDSPTHVVDVSGTGPGGKWPMVPESPGGDIRLLPTSAVWRGAAKNNETTASPGSVSSHHGVAPPCLPDIGVSPTHDSPSASAAALVFPTQQPTRCRLVRAQSVFALAALMGTVSL
jgi:hypothetical protein